jgi:8-oxo-dGTP pyrophosphatase MutT (NUDIX family)
MNQGPENFKTRIRDLLAARSRQTVDDLGLGERDPDLICAAVLIPLLYKEGHWHVAVTQRTQNVEHHKGQISFPGGACEPGDDDLQATALRETWEEIGVPPEAVEVLGALDDFVTISHFVVTPFVGVISEAASFPYPFAYRLNLNEVDGVVEVPLSFLFEESNLRVEQREHDGRLFDVLFWDFGPYTIWGVTARMLQGLLDLIRGSSSGTLA